MFWNPSNQRSFLDLLAKKLNIRDLDDWYKVKKKDFVENGGQALLNNYYGGSVSKAITTLYPDHVWKLHRFENVPRNYWADPKNRRSFFEDIAKGCNVKERSDWYRVSKNEIKRQGGSRLLQLYSDSPSKALIASFPEYDWKIHEFNSAPLNHWSSLQNRRKFFDDLAHRLNIKSFEDWYNVSEADVSQNGGAGLLRSHYNGSHVKALVAIYPEHDWQPWRFAKTPVDYFVDVENQRLFMNHVAKLKNVKHSNDWKHVSKEFIRSVGGESLLIRYKGSLLSMLQKIFPEEIFDEDTFVKLAGPQEIMYRILKRHVPDLVVNYRHPNLLHSKDDANMELDFYSASLNLAIEYQGEQHYSAVVV
eukprot:TRINITY_DN7678_c1_g1_i3.p1 TRINITY_DN7678_c1_g1~~TRINITY_DN7678_c1_g1_i3.p1  ORF type:complete len:362 (-),score=85.74 TRINITY_DN7678_c1_g1_i3:265-1350(-)